MLKFFIFAHVSSHKVLIMSIISNSVGFNCMVYTYFFLGCDVHKAADSGEIFSPGYPNRYPQDTSCQYKIFSNNGHFIHLTFTKFSLTQSENCENDYLKVYDGLNSDILLGTFCGNELPPKITSRGNTLLLVFKSSSGSSADGFHATYLTGSDGIFLFYYIFINFSWF